MRRAWVHVGAATIVAALVAYMLARPAWGLVPRVWTDVAQVQLWAGWQVASNVRRGLDPFVPTSLAWVDGHSVLGLVGNPGAAWVQALASLALAPAEARLACILAMFVTNVAALAALGAVDAGTRGAWVGACAAFALTPATWELACGAWSAGWVAPGVATVALARAGAHRTGALAGAIGAVCAPVPTLIASLVGCLLPGRAGGRPLPLLLVLCASGAVAFAMPPMGASEGVRVQPGQWVPFGAGAGASLPVLAWVALARSERAWWLPMCTVGCAIVALGSLTGGGAELSLAGVRVELPWGVARPGEWLVAAALTGLMPIVARPCGRLAALGLIVVALVDMGAQAARGVAVLPGQGYVPVAPPAVLSGLRGTTLLLPLADAREGLVGWLPFVPGKRVGGPGLHRASPARALVEARLDAAPTTRPLLTLGRPRLDDGAPSPRFALRDAGVDDVVLLVGGGAAEVAASRRLGVGSRGEGGVVWSMAAPQREAFGPRRGLP